MQTLAILGIVFLVTLAGANAAAKSNKVDFEEIAQHLQRYIRELRDVEEAMRVHAKTTMPKGLDKNQRGSLAAKRRELNATADAVLKLVSQLENRERKARRRVLTRVDMESLGVEADHLARKIDQRMERSIGRKSMISGSLSDTIKDIESMQETVRNKRQMASTAFQNFDQKANQLYNLLSSVMKAVNEMRRGTVRNML